MIKKIVPLLLISSNLCFAHSQESVVPPSWYQYPEDSSKSTLTTNNFFEEGGDTILSSLLKKIFSVNVSLLDQIAKEPPQQLPPSPSPMNDYTPWHLEFATTELSLSASGGIGVLSAKGTPTIQAYWRKQNKISKEKSTTPILEEKSSNPGLIAMDFDPGQDEKAVLQSIEPMAKAALATGKIKNETVFRSELQKTAKEFYYLTNNLNVSPGSAWWLSSFRFDLLVDGSGRIIANPLLSVGGEVRLRFDFKRIKNQKPVPPVNLPPHSPTILSNNLENLRKDMQGFIASMAKDLEIGFADGDKTKGLQAYNFRIGIAFTAGGNIGVIKGSAGAWAHLNFSRDVSAPIVNPPKVLVQNLAEDNTPLYVIEANAPQAHIEYAKLNQIPFEMTANKGEVSYQVDRKAFREGLTKAAHIGIFFADKGVKVVSESWKLWQLRTGFDMSLTGKVALVTFGGTVSSDITFYNKNF
ncbi:MAG: hypothetical protein ACXWRA_03905 [Pseudobdellovibrionaceae bacterium]